MSATRINIEPRPLGSGMLTPENSVSRSNWRTFLMVRAVCNTLPQKESTMVIRGDLPECITAPKPVTLKVDSGDNAGCPKLSANSEFGRVDRTRRSGDEPFLSGDGSLD